VKISRRTGAGIALAGVALALSACGQPQAGAALTWDGGRITEAQVTEDVAVLTADLLAVAQANSGNAEMAQQSKPDRAVVTNATLNRLASDELSALAAEAAGVSVTEGQVDQELDSLRSQYGGEAGLAQAAVLSGIPAEGIRDYVRSQLQLKGIASALGAQQSSDGRAAPELTNYLAQVSVENGFTANPRFGAWIPQQLAVIPQPDELSRLPEDPNALDLPPGLQQQ
jgi:hypothetical protein